MPDDHSGEKNGTFTLSSGSDAAIWASCQPFRDHNLVKDKRSLTVSLPLTHLSWLAKHLSLAE